MFSLRLAMRRSLLILFTIVILFGLPRLVNEIRENAVLSKEGESSATLSVPSSQAEHTVRERPQALALQDAGAPIKSLKATSVPVSLRPADISIAAKPVAAISTAGLDELIPAIEKELKRLGYYDGPVGTAWSTPVRAAARNFIHRVEGRARNIWPTSKLLEALRATHPEAGRGASGNDPQLTLRPAGLAVSPPMEKAAVPADTTPVNADNDSYLPPWERKRIASYQVAAKPDIIAAPKQRPQPIINVVARRTISSEWAESQRHVRRRYRHDRAARARRAHASVRERRMREFEGIFSTPSYTWQ